ncbi:hypothetical protein ABPG75_013445 [Micractinium tetrahymenae]
MAPSGPYWNGRRAALRSAALLAFQAAVLLLGLGLPAKSKEVGPAINPVQRAAGSATVSSVAGLQRASGAPMYQWRGAVGAGLLSFPAGLAALPNGTLYVPNYQSNTLLKISSKGALISSLGTPGSGPGQLNGPASVAVDIARSRLYVAEVTAQRVQVFDLEQGSYLAQLGGAGSFSWPTGLAINEAGDVYAADQVLSTIQKFAFEGTLLWTVGGTGSDPGQFTLPVGLTYLGGDLFVVEYLNNRIQRLDGGTGAPKAMFGSAGSGPAQFHGPELIASSPDGSLFVTDSGNYRVQQLSSSGDFITSFGSNGADAGQFQFPFGIAVQTSARGQRTIYVADGTRNDVQIFDELLPPPHPSPRPSPPPPKPHSPSPPPPPRPSPPPPPRPSPPPPLRPSPPPPPRPSPPPPPLRPRPPPPPLIRRLQRPRPPPPRPRSSPPPTSAA